MKYKIIGVSVLAVLMFSMSLSPVFASVKPKRVDRDQIKIAFEENNYEMYKNLLDGNRHGDITKEQFDILTKSYNLHKEGKHKEAFELLKSSNLESLKHNKKFIHKKIKNEKRHTKQHANGKKF